MPDPLAPGHIPGQNPATPQRMPGHTASANRSYRHLALWGLIAVIGAIVALYAVGVVGH